jgi:hypothetical protein
LVANAASQSQAAAPLAKSARVTTTALQSDLIVTESVDEEPCGDQKPFADANERRIGVRFSKRTNERSGEGCGAQIAGARMVTLAHLEQQRCCRLDL